ncbi:MAG TPA: DUF2723 domain-containing protein [Verrucomicrobiae bacterium]|nr:DUF2723 domain-containing protein [Verrucomicrobiae bacterium]
MFAVTAFVALFVYGITLAPQVTFGWSGVFATAAMYPGPSTPSGHPIWAICGWAWINVFPFGNIAWRLAFGSAVAAAIACGVVAVIVARVGKLISAGQKGAVVFVGSIVAGLGLAFEQGFWSKAVVVDSWSLTGLCFALILYCFSRWFFEPLRRRWLYGAAFLAGAGLCESQSLAPAIYILPLFAALGDVKVGRDLLLAESIALWSWLAGRHHLGHLGWNVAAVWGSATTLATATAIAWMICWWRSGKPLGEFKCSITCIALFSGGLLLCFLSPVLSMTNPPMNWGYPRTEEGFAHVLSRGQYDSFAPPPNVWQVAARFCEYVVDLIADIGPMYLLAACATLPLCWRAPRPVRKWIAGMWVTWIVVTLISVAALNVEAREIAKVRSLFDPGNAVLMVLAGCGITFALRRRKARGA